MRHSFVPLDIIAKYAGCVIRLSVALLVSVALSVNRFPTRNLHTIDDTSRVTAPRNPKDFRDFGPGNFFEISQGNRLTFSFSAVNLSSRLCVFSPRLSTKKQGLFHYLPSNLAWYCCEPNGPGGGGPVNGKSPNYDDKGIVDFSYFAVFADAWLTENPLVNLDNDADFDIYDLKLFCNAWLEE